MSRAALFDKRGRIAGEAAALDHDARVRIYRGLDRVRHSNAALHGKGAILSRGSRIVGQRGIIRLAVEYKRGAGNDHAGIADLTGRIAGADERTAVHRHLTRTGHDARARP